MRVERTDAGVNRRPPVLKTGRITGPHALPDAQRFYRTPASHRMATGAAEAPVRDFKRLLLRLLPRGTRFAHQGRAGRDVVRLAVEQLSQLVGGEAQGPALDF